MQLAYKIGIRLMVIALFALCSNWVYKRFFYEDFLKEDGVLLYRVQRSMNADYLYFSASSDYSYHPKNDSDQRRCSIIAMDYCNKQIKSISEGAHHAGVFLPLIKHIPQNSIEGIIVALNIRSFSPEWIYDINGNSLNQDRAIYEPNPPLYSRFLVALKHYDHYTKKESEKRIQHLFKSWSLPYPFPKDNIYNWCAVEKYGDWKSPKRQLADHYIKSYGFIINDKHPRIQDFDQIVEEAHNKKLNLIFHILPENMEEADQLIGDTLTSLIEQNSTFLMNRYHHPEQNVWVINNLNRVSNSHFTDRDFPTEHYDITGRTIIAKSIGEQIQQIQ